MQNGRMFQDFIIASYLVSSQAETSLNGRLLYEVEIKMQSRTMRFVHHGCLGSRHKQPQLDVCDTDGLRCAEQELMSSLRNMNWVTKGTASSAHE